MVLAQDGPERVGNFTFSVRFAEPTPESRAKWSERIDALADLLLVLWEAEQHPGAPAAEPSTDRRLDLAARN